MQIVMRTTSAATSSRDSRVRQRTDFYYRTESGADGLPAGEGVFLPCSFWLADVYQLQGRVEEADALLDRLLTLSNDLGLLSEEYYTEARCQVGNFPQAFSHLAFVHTALSLRRKEPLRRSIEAQ